MWVRLAVLLAQLLFRLAARFAPFLLIMAAGLARKYRWQAYDKLRAYTPRSPAWSRAWLVFLGLLGLLIGLGIALYVLVGRLAPD